MEYVPDNWKGGIEELVAEANARLQAVLPDDRAARPKDEVNARLVRHYTTQGLLPAPWREGREARYGALHLLSLLALRRLMAYGLSGKALYAALDGKTLQQLTELITLGTGGVEGLAWPANANFELMEEVRDESNPALRYLQSLKRKAAPSTQAAPQVAAKPMLRKRDLVEAQAAQAVPAAAPPPAPAPASAKRAEAPLPDFLLPNKLRQQRTLRNVEVQPGLELQVASDFEWPEDEPHWQALMQELRAVLHEIERDE